MSAPRYVQLINMGGDHCGMGLTNDYPDGHEDAATRSRADDSEWIKASDHDDLVRELVEALAQAAVPLEGLTLAAHATGSNMGLCKGTWDEINNGVAHIRAALAKIAQEG